MTLIENIGVMFWLNGQVATSFFGPESLAVWGELTRAALTLVVISDPNGNGIISNADKPHAHFQ